MRLLPRLRVGELDPFVGRLEPGYAAPDLDTEALFDEPMSIVARPDHPLRHLQAEDLANVLNLRLPIDLPPVGIITMRGRRRTPATEQLIECLRRVATRPR